MSSLRLNFSNNTKISNLKLLLVIFGMPLALLPVRLLTKFARDQYFWLPNHTGNLITPTLILYLVMYFIFIYLVLNKSSGLSPKELGLEKDKLKTGAVVTILLFLILQVYGVLYSSLFLNKLVSNEVLTKWTESVGYYVELIFGVALFEEVVYRGFLIPQVFIRLRSNNNSRMLRSLVISQILFSLVHIPIRIINGIDLPTLMVSLAAVLAIGLIFSFVYLLTENLFIAMGVHALWDASMNGAASIYTSKYDFVVVLIFVFVLMYISAAKKNKRALSLE